MKIMLAGKAGDLSKLSYPVLVSPKYDGVRAYVKDGVVYSRKNKPIPNAYVQDLFGEMHGFDGELIVGEPNAGDVFRKTSSGVMSRDGEPDVEFYVFDHWVHATAPFRERIVYLARSAGRYKHRNLVVVGHAACTKRAILEKEEQKAVDLGYEGLMIRHPMGPYKFGRSTTNEGYLLKLKRFEDSEAVIIGFEEEMHNANEKGADGQRTSHKAGMVAKGTLGAFRVTDLKTKATFNVGTGLSAAERATFWRNRQKLIGRAITYRFFPGGSKDAPRFPTFVGFREDV